MKACLYLEFLNFLGGVLYNRIGTGLLSSFKNQKRILERLGIGFVEKWDDGCDLLIINTPWLKSLYLAKRARRLGKRIFIWAHVTAEDARMVFRFTPWIWRWLKMYLAYAYCQADVVLCPSEHTKSLLVAYGLSADKLVVQSNGVDLDLFYEDKARRDAYRRQYGLDSFTVGTVGLAIPRKGIDTFLDLAREFSDLKFVWYGKIYSSLLAKPLPKDLPANAAFTGYVEDILAAFNSLDVFIFPSYEENQGMAILEAAAVGLPIIVRDIGAYSGWLVHGENCLKAKDDSEFAAYLRDIMDNEELREKIGRNAKALAERESLDSLSGGLRDILLK